MEISAEQVRELREKSGAGLMDCKRALQETSGDLEKAHENLRKSGVIKAAKKAGRATLEGLIGEAHNEDYTAAALIEVNCETDFVARTDQFQKWVNDLAQLALQKQPSNLESFLTEKLPSGEKVSETVTGLIAKLGENIEIRRIAVVKASAGEKVASYLHMGSKIGALLRVKGGIDVALLREIAMHIAALQPRYLDRAQVPSVVLEKEKEILKSQLDMAGKGNLPKPAQLLDKIVEGKINRFYSEACLTEQPFIKDATGKKTVSAVLKERDAAAKIIEMVRFQVGGELHG